MIMETQALWCSLFFTFNRTSLIAMPIIQDEANQQFEPTFHEEVEVNKDLIGYIIGTNESNINKESAQNQRHQTETRKRHF